MILNDLYASSVENFVFSVLKCVLKSKYLSLSLSLFFFFSLKRKQPPGFEILLSGKSNTVTLKGMNCSPIAFREFLFIITLGLLDVCVF